jgi:hypothetical protein
MKLKKFAIYLFMIFCLLSISTINAKASGGRVYYSTDTNVTVGQSFNIYVKAENLNDLYGSAVRLALDPTLVQVEGISLGNLYNGLINNVDYFTVEKSNYSQGIIDYAVTLLGPTHQVGFQNATGDMFVIRVKALRNGTIQMRNSGNPDYLDIYSQNICIQLSNSNAQSIDGVGFDIYDFNINQPGNFTLYSIGVNYALVYGDFRRITISAMASSTTELEYEFRVFNGTQWTTPQTYSSKDFFNWTPTAPGNYEIYVYAKEKTAPATSAVSKVLKYTIH